MDDKKVLNNLAHDIPQETIQELAEKSLSPRDRRQQFLESKLQSIEHLTASFKKEYSEDKK